MLTAIAALALAQSPGTPVAPLKNVAAKVSFCFSEEAIDWRNVVGKTTVIKDAPADMPQRTTLFTGTTKDFIFYPYGTGFAKPGAVAGQDPILHIMSSPIVRSQAGMPAYVAQGISNDRRVGLKVVVSQSVKGPNPFDVTISYTPNMPEEPPAKFPFERTFNVGENQSIILGFDPQPAPSHLQAIAIFPIREN